MAKYEIVEAPKNLAPSKDAVRQAIANERPGYRIEAIRETEDAWEVRIAKIDGRVSGATRVAEFPFKDDEDSKDDSSSEDKEEPSDAPDVSSDDSSDDDGGDSEDSSDSSEGDDDSSGDFGGDEKKDDKDNKDDGEGDALGKLRELVNQIQSLFDELQNKAQETVDKADAQQKAVDEIGDTLDAHRSPKAEPGLGPDAALGLEDIGPGMGTGGPNPPVPGAGGGQPPKKLPGAGAPGASGVDKRKKPLLAPGQVSTFSRHHEVATHPGVDEEGNRISLTAAAHDLEQSEVFAAYEVVSIVEDDNGQYVAKLRLRD